MPTKAPHPCNRCGKPITKKCGCQAAREQEQRTAYEKERGTSHSRGYGGKWLDIRKRILVRDMFRCQTCNKLVIGKGQAHVDHIIPKERGGTDSDSNLQTLCFKCHSRKTATEDGAFGNRTKTNPA